MFAKFNTAGAVLALALLPMSANAATFNITNGTNDIGGLNTVIGSQFNIAEGSTAATMLVADSLVNVTLVKAADEIDTIAALGFNFTPVPSTGKASASLSTLSFADFGSTKVYLSQDATIDGGDLMATMSGAGDSFLIGDVFGASPFFVIFDWTNDTTASSLSFQIGVSAVPVPAAGFLLLGALGGLGMMRRRRKAA